ncbi:MAG: leucine--tRNA ligase [Actinobacteria bacterium]|nr:leucine--tRNA ligase [Cyanobacteriota bacterium]MCL5772141.1 leucine--tRNA ligase [Actinomycetota bacterium]
MQDTINIENYNHKLIEEKWYAKWEENKTNILKKDKATPKYYCLEMFPYPSGEPHMGHARNYTIGDVIARFYSRKGYNVLHPMGFDAFGLPAENAAIKSGIHPKESTFKNIDKMRVALKKLGMTYDFNDEVITCEPQYYKWTQWLFLLLYKMNLAEKKSGPVNWCNSCQTVLANEQVINGRCERCDSEVVRKNLSQWYFKITRYAQALLDDMELLSGWPEKVLTIQRNWIGRSEGARINFKLLDDKENIKIPVFTTRPDTVFGVTFFILAPEHPLVDKIITDPKIKNDIKKLKDKISKQTDIERGSTEIEKIGGFTGRYVINPLNGEKVPVWIANYVLSDYGTGAIMAVPAHDERDFEFAKKYGIEIREVISPSGNVSKDLKEVYTGEGIMVNSGAFNGLSSAEGRKKIIEFLIKNRIGNAEINYKLKDWLISRQRYWGAPIPIVYCEKCGTVPVPEKDLPVVLPYNVDFKPTGLSPLAYIDEFVNTTCPKCGGKAKRETDTMDTFVCSSWYFLRYCSPHDSKEPFNKDDTKFWMPVDQYIGGIEHATMHLIYSRFFTKVLFDAKLINFKEPFTKYYPHGVITLGGQKMSKSKGNIVNPSEIYNKYGSDTLRLYILFVGPADSIVDWSDSGVEGSYRFLGRFWRLINQNILNLKKYANYNSNSEIDKKLQKITDISNLSMLEKEYFRKLHKTIKKVTEDILRFNFNTAISAMMELVNMMYKYNDEVKPQDANYNLIYEATEKSILLISPIAPFIAEELWSRLGKKFSVHEVKWPDFESEAVKEDMVVIVFQINGKIRDKSEFPAGTSEKEVEDFAFSSEKIKSYIKGKKILKKIYVQDKLYSIVVA